MDSQALTLEDNRVDNFQDQDSGVIDQVEALSFDVPENTLISNLNRRIQDSEEYWDKPGGFNLKQVRRDNQRLYLGKHVDQRKLYRYQTPYVENQIYVGEEAIVAYLTAQSPSPEVYPAQNTKSSKIFAQDLEKAMKAHSDMFHVQEILDGAVRNVLNKRVGAVKFEFDPNYGKNGEIIPKVINPAHIVVDKNAKQSENPAFICEYLKMSLNEILSRWPKKREEVFTAAGIVRGTLNQLETVYQVREVWFTYYDKKYQPQEGLVFYFDNVVLEKIKNPNYIYATEEKNFLPIPLKPYIPLNFDNDGEHWVDYTGPIEQAGTMQDILNKRGRQLMEVADKANGVLLFSTDSGLSKDDVQNLTGDPNQRIIVNVPANGKTEDVVYQVPPPQVPTFLFQDKVDLRTQVHAIMGTPSEFTGSDDGGQTDPTLGQSQMKKNQASGRQDLFMRAIDRFLTRYFNYLVQMMVVWYNEKHFFTYNGGDGEFDYITISRDLIEEGIIVNVKSGSTLPFDKGRQEAIALKMAEMKLVSPLDFYKLANLPNPQQLYDNWAKFTTDPMTLARDANDEVDDNRAYIAYTEIMNGKDAEDPDDCTKEFVLSLRKLMITDKFLRAPHDRQRKFIDYVEKAVKSLELRTSLDQMSDEGGVSALDPRNPIQPPQPPQPPQGAPSPMPPAPVPAPGAQSPPLAPPIPPLGGSPLPPLTNPGAAEGGPVLPTINQQSPLPNLPPV